MATEAARLQIQFHGRVIEHLGIDMYQSPVAAIAELVSNAWDADATEVDISLPINVRSGSEILIGDNGDGMTLEQCQDRYLKVGYNRRVAQGGEKTPGGRPVMGRKGIGKFAGFGIANLVDVETVSKETGERTIFRLDVEKLTGSGAGYADNTPMEVEVLDYSGPDEKMKSQHGTRIRLQGLTVKKTPNSGQFRVSMARRFLLMERAEDFTVTVDGSPIAEESGSERIEFDYPSDYEEKQIPSGLKVEDGWGVESLPNGEEIRWRFVFYKDPIQEEDLAGVSVFSHHKLSQRPFAFNLSGGFGAQHAINYLSGRVQADYIDDQEKDLISTERQRINWDSEQTLPLLTWGQERTKSLLRIWQSRRAEAKVGAMNTRMAPFSSRLGKLEPYEARIVKRALTAVARVSVLSDGQFDDLANAILGAWEGGRLKELINELSNSAELDAEELVGILARSRVMTALHAAEHVRSQLNLISGLEDRIKARQLENAVRDYIAENPWMISPEWETFRVERGLSNLMEEIYKETLDKEEAWRARVDLVLSSGDQLLVLEFMRPGKTADWDHVDRFERYIESLRDVVDVRRSEFRSVTGLMVADKLERPAGFARKLERLRRDGMDATDWAGLLAKAKAQWQDYFDILYARAPEDERMQALVGAGADDGDSDGEDSSGV
ncbi:ATP-binding protein [Streptomyces sp. NPDC101237]|uniref:ATP-binding protein n=1 Tax=Streptomyces sp. NPDC101237 TaxID=3366139 RepID=UPI0037FE2E62